MPLSDEMKAQGWIEHDGGPCPVKDDIIVDYLLRAGPVVQDRDKASSLIWQHDSALIENADHIIAYRVQP